MTILLLWLPFLNFLLNLSMGRVIGISGMKLLTLFLMGSCLIVYFILTYDYMSNTGETLIIISKNFLNSEFLFSSFSLSLNSLSLSMLFPILFISFFVHVYSMNYMSHDPHQQRFMAYLSLFTVSMIFLVTSNSLFQIFIGWEMIGISSYLLIGFWNTRSKANQSSLNAFIMNRLGDVAFSIALYLIYFYNNTFNIDLIINLNSEMNLNSLLVLTILMAAMAKSAQLGFQTWLPLAMEGPTPVSALIHAATLVTAGAFLLMRLSPMLILSNQFLICCGIIGSLTCLYAGTIGLLQNDMKRIIAFSTCSQMGYLFLAIGLGQFNIALFHLINHAMFKALLFLSAGMIIHSIKDNQDIRKLGGLINFLPICYITLLIGNFSLMAMPFLTGFYSKELILELSFMQYSIHGLYLYWLGVFSALLTGFYSMRLLFLIFFTKPKNNLNFYNDLDQPNMILILPLIVLSILSILLGYYLKEIFMGLGNNFLIDLFYNHNLVEVETNMKYYMKMIPLMASIIGAFFGSYFFYLSNNFFLSKWYFDVLYNYICENILKFALLITKFMDRGILEIIGPFKFSNLFMNVSFIMLKKVNYKLPNLALIFMLALISMIWLYQYFNYYLIILAIVMMF